MGFMIRKKTTCLLTVILFSLCAMLPAEPAVEQQEKTIRTEQAGAKEDSLLDTLGIDVHSARSFNRSRIWFPKEPAESSTGRDLN